MLSAIPALVPALLAGTVAALLTPRRPGERLATAVRRASARSSTGRRPPSGGRAPLPPGAGSVVGGLLGGCLLLAGAGPIAPVAGVLAALALRALLRRAEPARVGRVRTAVADELPWALDLLAAATAAGCPPALALGATATALGDSELARRLAAVAGASGLGADPADAWAPALADGAEELAPTADAFAAASTDGSRLADRLLGAAAAARERRGAAALAAAERAGIRSVLPLGLCYLPAFVLVGIVPVVAAALHRV